jgi:hypothetical protein
MSRRPATIVVIAIVAILAACGVAESRDGVMICEHYDDDPIPPGYDENGCWAPTEYFELAPTVIPEVDDVAPVLRIEATGDVPAGIEGQLFFVRAISPTGRIVLDRDWEWPGMEQKVPPGAYQVTAYLRYCDGNCSLLDPPTMSCTVDLLAEPSFTYTITYEAHGDGSVSCDAAADAT